MNKEKAAHGLVIVHTGNGKGKTTSALGLALRGVGHGLKTLVIQFVKGNRDSGELKAARLLLPYLEILPMGQGMVRMTKRGPSARDIKAATEAWEAAGQAISSGEYHMIVMDEINVAMSKGLLPEAPVLDSLMNKPAGLHLVLTGRNAPAGVLEAADIVTEMKEIKHPFKKGVKAQKGIEF